MPFPQFSNKLYIHTYNSRTIAHSVRSWFLITEARVHSWVLSCEILGWRNGTEGDFSEFLRFPLLIVIPPLLHSHPVLTIKMCNNPSQQAHYHITNF
jgi:hypothetical protein